MKMCPFCAEQIQDAAVKCKHCGERLTSGEFARPEPATERGLVPGMEIGGRYRIVAVAGRGGMGVVYRARDLELERDVALKVLPEEVAGDKRAVAQMKEEARIGLELTHAHIVRLYDFREMDGLYCLVMECVVGGSLWERLEHHSQGLPEQDVVRWLNEVCAGLAYAHAHGVLHRDIKPGNLLLDGDGRVKVADFGIARVARDSYTRMTGHQTSGTLLYMSPEQLRGKKCDARSDVYSLGVTAYELLSGEPPFATGDIFNQHLHEAPERPGQASPWFWAVLARMLAKEPAARYQAVAEVAASLKEGGRAPDRARQEAEAAAKHEAAERVKSEAEERGRRETADKARQQSVEQSRKDVDWVAAEKAGESIPLQPAEDPAAEKVSKNRRDSMKESVIRKANEEARRIGRLFDK